MEDTYSTLQEAPVSLFGVYDGHGGDEVSIFLADNLLSVIQKNLAEHWKSDRSRQEIIQQTLMDSFLEVNEQYRGTLRDPASKSAGSTSVVAAIYSSSHTWRMAVANTGDSRGILCCSGEGDTAIAMSEDHKPNDPKERARIEESGGFVTKIRRGPHRVNGVLATSRAFGDYYLAPQVIADPEIIDVEIGSFLKVNGSPQFTPSEKLDDTILLLGSDGLWDVFSSNEAAILVRDLRKEGFSAHEISGRLVQLSFERGSMDNITALVVFLDDLLEKISINNLF